MRTLLEDIVGKENIVTDPEILKDYSRDQSFVEPRMPEWVVFPQDVGQIQDLVKFANQENTPLIPFSSGLNLHGATIPDHGGIIMDMKNMNQVLDVDEKNRYVVIEPGVTYRELQDALSALGLRIMVPWGVPPSRWEHYEFVNGFVTIQ